MATKRHKPEEVVTKLRQVDVLVGQGQSRIDAIRQVQTLGILCKESPPGQKGETPLWTLPIEVKRYRLRR